MKNIFKIKIGVLLLMVLGSCQKEPDFTDMTQINTLTDYDDLKKQIGIYADFLYPRQVDFAIYSSNGNFKVSGSHYDITEKRVNLGGAFFFNNTKLECDEQENKLYLPKTEISNSEIVGKDVNLSFKDKDDKLVFESSYIYPNQSPILNLRMLSLIKVPIGIVL
jgi:hypothetical protein